MKAGVRWTLLSTAFVGVLAMTPFRMLKITGHSMEPTFRNGETYLLDQFYWRQGGVRRDDIVVVKHMDENWVKRLVGMPGDHLQVVYDRTGWITEIVNVTADPQLRSSSPGAEERVVAPDEIFVIGDNLNHSADSTVQEAGAFKLRDIIGVVRTFALQRRIPFRQHP
ncbi:MAG TPA: signal peptidase I [Armatimonadota bacterium]|nr:signal peptidase I [Armatimonadota bacterium]